MTISFGQGDCASSTTEALHSNGHENCHAIIAYNATSGEALMFHVWEAALRGLNEEQKEAAQAFIQKPGKKLAVRVLGSNSYIYNENPEWQAKSQLEAMGLSFADDIDVSSAQRTWQLTFDPKSHALEVSTDEGRPLYTGTLFTNSRSVLAGSAAEARR